MFPTQGFYTPTCVMSQETDLDVKMLWMVSIRDSPSLMERLCCCAKDAERMQNPAEKALCSQPAAASPGEREEIWDTRCCDPLLQWLKKLRRPHAFFSVDYPCFAGDELQIFVQL